MAVEGPKMDWGWGLASTDFRNSTYSGTTRAGPNGSGQFLAVRLSTTADFTVVPCGTSARPIGILQNKPTSGIAADVTFLGISKVVAGTTTITNGIGLMTDSSGCMTPFTTVTGNALIGQALESPGTVGQVFSAIIFGIAPPYFG